MTKKKTPSTKKKSSKPNKVVEKSKKSRTTSNTKTKAKDAPKKSKSTSSKEVKTPPVGQPKDYKFRNYFESETQLKDVTAKSDPEEILKAYSRLILVCANNHVREGVELEDLIGEGQKGIVEAIIDFPKKKRRYNFQQFCLYKIRQHIYQYCLSNANQIKTPYYIQRGCMHVGQIFKLMSNQSTAEKLLNRRGPASEQEIIDFLHDDKERLPLKPMKFIKDQITKDPKSPEFKQILSGVLNHELGSRHSYVKNNLTDVGKILHIKEKLWYTASSNNMDYGRVIGLILSARRSKVEFTPNLHSTSFNRGDTELARKQLIEQGIKVCGETNFKIFVENKMYDKNYEEIAEKFSVKKSEVVDIIKKCIKLLRKDPIYLEMFKDL